MADRDTVDPGIERTGIPDSIDPAHHVNGDILRDLNCALSSPNNPVGRAQRKFTGAVNQPLPRLCVSTKRLLDPRRRRPNAGSANCRKFASMLTMCV
jgi:hypothetical protein